MAEVTGLRNNALPYPVYGVPWGVVFPMLDADGDLVTGATTPDAEKSLNGDTFSDCTNESTEIATNSGMWYLLLTGAEMTADVVAVIAKSATAGMKTTPIVLYPAKLVSLRAGTVGANAGDGTTLQLDSSAVAIDDYYNGCLLVGTLDSAVESRVISDYAGSTKVCTVSPAFVTTPDNNDTFVVYQPWGRQFIDSNMMSVNGTAQTAGNLATMITAVDDLVDTEVAAIKTVVDAVQAKTDNLPSDPADASVVAGLIAAAEAKIDTIDGIVDSILVDTAEIGAAGAGLTNINLPNQTMDIVGNITGNLSGTVGSVTGAVGSVTGLTASDVGAIKTKTDSLTFTVAGKTDANVTAVNGDALSAAYLAKTTRVIGRGTASGGTTTSITTSAFLPAGAVADQFKGRIITFDADTTTTALRGQSTDITASSNASAPTFTVTALTTAAASGDTFSVT